MLCSRIRKRTRAFEAVLSLNAYFIIHDFGMWKITDSSMYSNTKSLPDRSFRNFRVCIKRVRFNSIRHSSCTCKVESALPYITVSHMCKDNYQVERSSLYILIHTNQVFNFTNFEQNVSNNTVLQQDSELSDKSNNLPSE